MADELREEPVFEDIHSSSQEAVIPASKKKKGTITHIDKIVKSIAFLVALFVFLVFAAGAYILYKMDTDFSLISLCLLIAGAVFSLIALFLIYALGHIITQNNEILKRL